MLEDTAASNSSALVPRGPGDPQASLSVYPEMISGHERRIAALEQQLYALQLQVARSQPPTPQQATPYSAGYSVQHGGMPGYPPHNAEYDSPGLPAAPLPSHLGGTSEYSSPAKHESDSAGGPSRLKEGDGDEPDTHRGKRWKGEPGSGEPDFIAGGLVTEEEATMCFES